MNEPQQEVFVQPIQGVSTQPSSVSDHIVNDTLTDDERKRVILTQQMQQGQHFFVTIFRGLLKIFEEIASLISRR